MSYFKNLTKELANEKPIRVAQIERLTLKGKYPDASKIMKQLVKSILLDAGINGFKLHDSLYDKTRNREVAYGVEIKTAIPIKNIDKKLIQNTVKEIFGTAKTQIEYEEPDTIIFYLAVPAGD